VQQQADTLLQKFRCGGWHGLGWLCSTHARGAGHCSRPSGLSTMPVHAPCICTVWCPRPHATQSCNMLEC
jgi:hypothetical protein